MRTSLVFVNKLAVQVEATVGYGPSIGGSVLRFEVVKHLVCRDTTRVNVPPPRCIAQLLPPSLRLH